MDTATLLHIGTCSWKYDSWRGLIYPEDRPINYLLEYSRHYHTVEVDQWFWSLFKGDAAVLPKLTVVCEYAKSVPENFIFCIKIPNSITLTHHYNKQKNEPLRPNPHFLSIDLMQRFLNSLEPLKHLIGPLIFQFEYLNKQKMSHLGEFLERLSDFAYKLPSGFTYCVETRNPNYLTDNYFDFLLAHRLHHVFLQGYYMPSIFELYAKYKKKLGECSVIRLHGPGRQEIEKLTGKNWGAIVAPKDNDLELLAAMLTERAAHKSRSYLYVNNHFEGSAPKTITRIIEKLKNRH